MEFEYKGKKCSIDVKVVGQEHCLPRKIAEQNNRKDYSIHFVSQGFGTLQYSGKSVTLCKGSMFLLYAKEVYKYFPDKIEPWSYVWVAFGGENLDELLADCGFSREKPYLHFADSTEVFEQMKKLVESFNGTDTQDMVCSALCLLLFGNLVEHRRRYQRIGDQRFAFFKQFRDILIWINSNYKMNLSIAQIAENMYVSQKQLSYMFRANIGLTPINYINKFRISSACELLQKTNLMVKEVAQRVGLEDEKYFMRMFVKWKGISAEEYRKNCQDDDPFDWLKKLNLDLH